ncbi:hypothetical protein E4T38_06082 [Aureobasidium subglaciale]|nr:hypothetical protein E4T38_06082 [Aureobasidium subglaciale]KAI5220131.1 hypothetical protein E4T40_06103 [Aureobasidium subglaciale]KAI5223967.1 hypothetical protein E4T41_05943 [Aureobasidium subglaciale]KAI5260669.1 hypothetical protein E4T46_05837 [Aureobasidium subglaciale]
MAGLVELPLRIPDRFFTELLKSCLAACALSTETSSLYGDDHDRYAVLARMGTRIHFPVPAKFVVRVTHERNANHASGGHHHVSNRYMSRNSTFHNCIILSGLSCTLLH